MLVQPNRHRTSRQENALHGQRAMTGRFHFACILANGSPSLPGGGKVEYLCCRWLRPVMLALGAVLLARVVVAAEPDVRYVKMLNYDSAREFVVVAEGEFEPRSTGSYSLRIYAGSRSDFPADEFVTGVVRTRDGTIEAVQFYDFDADGRAEIVVLIRSAGSGGYLSADLFGYADKSLMLLASVARLAKDADPIAAFREKIGNGLGAQR